MRSLIRRNIKSTDKQNPNLLKKLQDDIKSDQQDLSELHRIARLNASLPDNDYMYQNFTQALSKKDLLNLPDHYLQLVTKQS
mgnify:CR=1 FL=1